MISGGNFSEPLAFVVNAYVNRTFLLFIPDLFTFESPWSGSKLAKEYILVCKN